MILDEGAVRDLLRMEDLIPVMASALADLSRGKVVQPMRVMVPIADHGGFLGLMPAYGGAARGQLGTVFPKNQGGPPPHPGIIPLPPHTGGHHVAHAGRPT